MSLRKLFRIISLPYENVFSLTAEEKRVGIEFPAKSCFKAKTMHSWTKSSIQAEKNHSYKQYDSKHHSVKQRKGIDGLDFCLHT